jgi:hypothetical protein
MSKKDIQPVKPNSKDAKFNNTPRFVLGWVLAFGILFGLIWSTMPTAEIETVENYKTPQDTSPVVAQEFAPFFNAPKTAVIVDQLSQYYPNPTFIQTATQLLEEAGYTVSYISYEEATVNFYRTLPTRADDFILLRVHGTAVSLNQAGDLVEESYVSLATGEAENNNHPEEVQQRWLGRFRPDNPAEPPTFTVMGGFFEHAMQGRFDDSVIIMMGCDGLRVPGTAKLFLDRGAHTIVGWSDNVEVNHMDKTIIYLLEQYLNQDTKNMIAAVQRTQEAIGVDPSYQAELRVLTR